ncbi:MAG: PAS domain-containing protein [Chitinophagaceae bacterium]
MKKLLTPVSPSKSLTARHRKMVSTGDILRLQAFENSLQANVLSTVSTGKLLIANAAACRLLGYSMKELLRKNRSTIFDTNETSFKKMLRKSTAGLHSTAFITAIKKSGAQFPCEITSAVFTDEMGIEQAVTTIADISRRIHDQKDIDIKKDKIVAENIVLAKTKQRVADSRKEKIVAADIETAKSKQRAIDVKKDKKVAHNITEALAKSDARLAANNEWIRYIAAASYDVMWDWDIKTGQIYAGESVSELFGYHVAGKTVYFKDFTNCLLPEAKETVKKKLMKVLDSPAKSWKDNFMFRRFDGSFATANCRASILRDDSGKAIRLIGAMHDVSRLQELEDRVVAHDGLKSIFQEAAKLSFDGIWYWNLLTNEFVISEGFEELFGYEIKNSTGKITADWSRYIHPHDKKAVVKAMQQALKDGAAHWQQTYRFIRANGSVADVFNRASIIRQPDGKACRMIGVMNDLSRQTELERKLADELAAKSTMLAEYAASFKTAFNSSADVFYNSDLITNQVIISEGYEREFGYKIAGNTTPAADWSGHIHPADKKMVARDYMRMLASKEIEWKCSYRFLRADNTVADVLSSGIVLRNEAGKAYRIIGSMHDISKEKVLEEKLAQEIRLREKQIADATEDAKNSERSDIGKELHDNINQLLGASRMYLQMARRGGENSNMYIARSSEYTLTAIEEIRKLTKGLITDTIKTLGLGEAIDTIVRDTMEVHPVEISSCTDSFIEAGVHDKFKLNVFRIVQEQLNNILKHASATKVSIRLSQNKSAIVLHMSDNGVGFDTGIKQEGIGLANIKSRAASFNGTADFVSRPGKGCVLLVTFPLSPAMLTNAVV